MNACLCQAILVYPSKMLYPSIIPLVSVLNAFHDNNKSSGSQYEYNKKRLRIFYFVFLTYVLHLVTVSQFLTSCL